MNIDYRRKETWKYDQSGASDDMINRRNNDGDGYRILHRIGKTQLAVHFELYGHGSPDENPGWMWEQVRRCWVWHRCKSRH